MRTRIKHTLTAFWRGLCHLARQLLSLVRLLFRLPLWLWRGLIGLFRLPGRLWRGFKAIIRFLTSIPARIRRSLRRLAFELHRLRLKLREWRARCAAWWRTRVLPPRTLSPRGQVVVVLTALLSLAAMGLLGTRLLHPAKGTSTLFVVTATPAPSVRITPTARVAPLPNATQAPDAPPLFGGGGAVAFALRRNGNTDVYVRKLDDAQLLRLTYHLADDREPAWAPDGETLAFVSQRENNWDIYRLDLVSGFLIRLTRHPHYDAHPSWSPDGAFIAFESYRSGNLDIYIMSADGSQVTQLTTSTAADFAPAWSPDGRHIAFVSDRDGSKDILLYPLDAGSESAVINLTQTPDRDEDAPGWSPDGERLAFSVGRFGSETIYITTFDWDSKFLDEAQTQLFNPGARPAWSPDGTSLIFEYRRAGRAFLIADTVTGWGAGQEIFGSDVAARAPNWGAPSVDPQIVAEQRQTAPLETASLYIEEVLPLPASGPPYTIVGLSDVNGGDDREFLSDRVNDSFEALRQRVLQESGIDYLATIGDSFRAIGVEPPPGQSPRNWHKAGRAFDLSQSLYEREDQLIELVREDSGFRTYWRVYLRAAQQDGSMGEPLRQAPWDLKARQEGGLAAREGGELEQSVPTGYYVDFTALAADYGWERVAANNRWRREWADVNWWQFYKPQGLTWLEAMLEMYRLDQIEAVFGPVE